jgi:hypothetical protein
MTMTSIQLTTRMPVRFHIISSNILLMENFFYSYVGNSKFDEARRKREEKKLQRQRELEARRAARGGPMKLGIGAKKL